MKVILSTIQEFIDELKFQSVDGLVFQQIVRTTRFVMWEQDEQISCVVQFCASYRLGKEGPIEIHEFSEVCGRDTQRAKDGSNKAAWYKKEIAHVCEENKLVLRPGKFELL